MAFYEAPRRSFSPLHFQSPPPVYRHECTTLEDAALVIVEFVGIECSVEIVLALEDGSMDAALLEEAHKKIYEAKEKMHKDGVTIRAFADTIAPRLTAQTLRMLRAKSGYVDTENRPYDGLTIYYSNFSR